MEATGGIGVILENRYYGNSQPFPDMSTDNLAYLTTEQSSSTHDLILKKVFLIQYYSYCG